MDILGRVTTRAASALRVSALAGAALLVSGCATFSPVQTEYDYPAADGVRLSITGLELRNLAIVTAAKGATGVLVGQAVNSGDSAVDVSFAVQGGAPATTATVPAHSGDTLSDSTSTVEIPAVPAPPGAMVELVVSTPQAGQNIVTVPVLAPTGYYASLPTPSASATPTP
jgi:hypothetical protein